MTLDVHACAIWLSEDADKAHMLCGASCGFDEELMPVPAMDFALLPAGEPNVTCAACLEAWSGIRATVQRRPAAAGNRVRAEVAPKRRVRR